MDELFDRKKFSKYQHVIFQVSCPEEKEHALELVEVCDQSNARVEQFAVYFAGPISPYLQQGTYMLKDAESKGIEVFLVPIGLKGDRMIYEAVFTQLIGDRQHIAVSTNDPVHSGS